MMKHHIDDAMKKIIVFIIVFALISSFAIFSWSLRETEPLRIGVLLPLTGPDARDSDEVLNWAMDNINRNGGINNRKIELVYKDAYKKDVTELAQEFIDAESIKIVIGPGSSAEVYEIAPMFIRTKKILISPLSTAGDVFRAFGKKKFFWRTCQGDVAQIRTILYILSSRDVERISLIYEDSVYGKTFFDWIGFFSMELGIESANMVKFDETSDFSVVVSEALEGEPEYIVCVAFPEDAVKIKRELDKTGSSAKLFLTDAAETPYLIAELGEAAEGLEGTTPAADPTTGFETAYETEFGHRPSNFAATTHDAFLLSVYTLARQENIKGGFLFHSQEEGIEKSFKKIVSGQGPKVGWNESNEAIDLMLQGKHPDISGASGPLEFDAEFGVDPLETFYSHWKVEAGDFRTVETISSGESLGAGIVTGGASATMTKASKKYGKLKTVEGISYFPEERRDLCAVIIATSSGWRNYRHQADALAMYNLLKSNGVEDDKIILLLIDDIAHHEKNRMKGDVHHTVGGKNLREDAVIDYSGMEVAFEFEVVNVENLKNVLLGNKTADTHDVLETNEHSNIFIYIVNHGAPGYIPFSEGGELTAEEFREIIEEMYKNKKYRQMFILIEVCFGESMALDIETPGVVFLIGASKNEPSFGANYDSEINAWLADDFTYQFLKIVSKEKNISIADLYTNVYERVAGSHVRLKNYDNFGDILTTPISEFIYP